MIERTVTISGREEDVATVLRLLRHMEYLGNVGASRNLLVWVDGDGCGQIHVTDESGEKLDNVHYSIEQNLAYRTMNHDLTWKEQGKHALHGMVSEIGELHGIYQKTYQGHEFNEEHAKKELGDLMWFIAEYCTAHGWELDDICQMNVDKLKNRYPDGFEADKSLHRKEGDI